MKIKLKPIEEAYSGKPVYVRHEGHYRKLIVKSREVNLFRDKAIITYNFELENKYSTPNDIRLAFKEYIDKCNKKIARRVKK
jgi:hypothetical protein